MEVFYKTLLVLILGIGFSGIAFSIYLLFSKRKNRRDLKIKTAVFLLVYQGMGLLGGLITGQFLELFTNGIGYFIGSLAYAILAVILFISAHRDAERMSEEKTQNPYSYTYQEPFQEPFQETYQENKPVAEKSNRKKRIVVIVFALLIVVSIVLVVFLIGDNSTNNNLGSNNQQEVEWISERDFFYYEDDGKYVLVFELADKNENVMTSHGTIEIKIVNEDNVTVYNKTRTFTESNFEEWTYDNTIDKLLATIYIDPNDIKKGTSSEGTVYFTVYGDDYYFEESTLSVYDLPLKPIQVTISKLPQSVNYYGYSGYTTIRIDSVTYEVKYDDSLYIYFAGEKTYDYGGNNATNSCAFTWKLYDSEGYLIDSGMIYISKLVVGDKFKNEIGYAFNCIEPGTSYRIVITEN